jgi:acetyl-CoA synthetase
MGTANGDHAAGASSDKLRHVESMSQLPSGAGKISGINALVLGESLAAEEHDLILPNPEFSASALVSSPQQVRSSPKFKTIVRFI